MKPKNPPRNDFVRMLGLLAPIIRFPFFKGK